jgi:aminopeptidase N
MLCNFVGQDIFLKGVSIYLKDHLYGNTTTKDLWDGINKATHVPDGVAIDVPRMMENWIVKVNVDKFDVSNRYLPSGWIFIDWISSAHRH